MSIIDRIRSYKEELVAIRQDLHAHPELGFDEERTSGIVAERLAEWGVEVHRGLGKTGVVGVLRSGSGNARRIGLRADMDALPIEETTGLAYASKNPGRGMPAAMTATRRCSSAPRGTLPKREVSKGPPSLSFSPPRRDWAALVR